MSETDNWLVHDHRRFEALLEECEIAAGAGAWFEAVSLFKDFSAALATHMRMEDEVLYPLFISETGDPEGSIASLSDEHDTILLLLNELSYIIKRNDIEHFEESLSPLYQAMLNHDAHEEAVFLQVKQGGLLQQREDILAQLHAIEAGQTT